MLPGLLQAALSLPDRPCAPPADLTTRRPPLSTPERWHWPRLPLWQPAHVYRWPLSVCQCCHPPTDQPGPAALCHHTCSGHNGWSLWTGYRRYFWWHRLSIWPTRHPQLGLEWLADVSCRFPGSKPCHGQLWTDSWRHQWTGDHTDNQQSQPDSSPGLSVLFRCCRRKPSGDHSNHIRYGPPEVRLYKAAYRGWDICFKCPNSL